MFYGRCLLGVHAREVEYHGMQTTMMITSFCAPVMYQDDTVGALIRKREKKPWHRATTRGIAARLSGSFFPDPTFSDQRDAMRGD